MIQETMLLLKISVVDGDSEQEKENKCRGYRLSSTYLTHVFDGT
jgi:hypothetical protein